jgi:choline dehydrogenase-like flavoprotein
MRHACAMVFGFCSERPDPGRVFHKHVAVTDYYRGDARRPADASRRLGSIQQVSTPPHILIESRAPFPFRRVPLHGFVEHLAGALVIAEDEPQAGNRLAVNWADRDPIGLPRLDVRHAYSAADEARRHGLVRRAKRILRGVGAWSFYTHEITTFSHAVGTVRMGRDPSAAPLDEWCRFRGLENLRVVDGSVLPTSGAVNPSLTIAAVALRAADRLVREESA